MTKGYWVAFCKHDGRILPCGVGAGQANIASVREESHRPRSLERWIGHMGSRADRKADGVRPSRKPDLTPPSAYSAACATAVSRLWFARKKLAGSYFALIRPSRSMLPP